MFTAETFLKLDQIFVDVLRTTPGETKPDSVPSHDLRADSVDAVEIAHLIEDRFGIELDDAEAQTIIHVSVQQTAERIEAELRKILNNQKR